MKRYNYISLIFALFLITSSLTHADEGMYPLSEIHKLNLKSKGLKVSSQDIFTPGKIGLVDAIVQVGGCTGSFVSPDGLIITNHHCAFGIVQAASSAEQDYIRDGFLAPNRERELPAVGYTVRITESYADVSTDVLGAVGNISDPGERSRKIDQRIRELVAEKEKQNPGKRVEIAEMFAGKAYTLFVYTFLKDVRAVYVPPRSIGEFGGEDDNWMWPRHTGDFAFLRAYVSKDGSSADYSPDNVPYHPRKFLRVEPNGVDENDPVFILGYPGRTFRHRTSDYLSYEYDVRMPYVADLYDWEIEMMEAAGKQNRAVAIKHAGRIKSLANVMKNHRGKLKGIRRLDLIGKKQEEERSLQAFIESDPKRKELYGTTIGDIAQVYTEMRSRAQRELTLDYLRQASTMFSMGYSLYEATRELQKPEAEREGSYTDRNFKRTRENYFLTLRNYDAATDRIFLREMLSRALQLPNDQRISAIDGIVNTNSLDSFLDQAYQASRISDSATFAAMLAKTPDELAAMNDPFVQLAQALYPTYQELKSIRQRRDGTLSRLSALLIDAKQEFQKKDFIPDANSTLRLTFGKITGYSPADALQASPITTLSGLADKSTGKEPYDTPAKLLEQLRAKDFGRWQHKRMKDVPVGLLYNLDTTGGNSGSPLLNANGELVGVNFDRAFEATVNDYAWSKDYSRSIAVDIRYVLWITEKVAGAGFLLEEMGIKISP